MDSFWLSILILGAVTAVGTILQRRSKDVCLKCLNHQPVVVQMKSGQWVWGQLEVYPKSLELVYEKPSRDVKGHLELSYLFFEDMLPHIQMILHPVPEKGTPRREAWQRRLDELMCSSLWEKMRRGFRNLRNTLKDAFSSAMSLFVGRLRTLNPSVAAAGADQHLTSVGQNLVAAVCNSYEPILEKYLGREVVAEILVKEQWREHVGVLEEYSDKYLLVRDLHAHFDEPGVDQKVLGDHFDAIFPRAHSVIRHLASRERAA
ncbi:MAG: hypothetical protein PHV34_05215 [Verrucomicrobiae bacterium]|nr:hypothetical protein [Verrucomicrobiae bacterium]